jgi:hypothetical protein
MDGGICKNEFQGAKGAFLLYADPNDIDRIKREKGAAIFSAFETKIQDISGDVLQEAIDKTNLSEDPFALGEDDAQQKLANQLTKNFRNAAADAIERFKKETTLTIDITAFSPSLIFYQKGCEVTHDETKEADSYGQLVSYQANHPVIESPSHHILHNVKLRLQLIPITMPDHAAHVNQLQLNQPFPARQYE